MPPECSEDRDTAAGEFESRSASSCAVHVGHGQNTSTVKQLVSTRVVDVTSDPAAGPKRRTAKYTNALAAPNNVTCIAHQVHASPNPLMVVAPAASVPAFCALSWSASSVP